MQKITPFLWFDQQAEAAMQFYTGIFKNSTQGRVTRYGPAGPGPAGSVMSATFTLDGQEFFALNGGPHFTFSPAISFFVKCETQAEVDYYWEQLGAGGQFQQCGWLQDKFGITWQIVPTILDQLLQSPDQEKSARVMQALFKMIKLDIAQLQAAYDQ